MKRTLEAYGRTIISTLNMSGPEVDVFAGYCEVNGQLHCTTRRWLNNDSLNSMVTFDNRVLDFGEDPRPFVYRGQPAIVSAVFVPRFAPRNHLFQVYGTEFERRILLLQWHIPVGKNWSPFTQADGSLAFLHSFDPPILLTEKRWEKGAVVLNAKVGKSSTSEMGPSNFSAYRGGSNGLFVDGLVIGVGHTTRAKYGLDTWELGIADLIHRPFLWVLKPETGNVVILDLRSNEYPVDHGVIDPTSLIRISANEFEFYATEVGSHFHDVRTNGFVTRYHFGIDSTALDAFRAELV
jgi:hypothetical protein